MDNFLSGREHLGDSPKPKDEAALVSPEVLEKLKSGEITAPNTEVKEEQGKCGSKVEYLSENGQVTKIIVTCSCGQVTEIDCEYEE